MEDGCTGEISINSSLIFGVSSLNADHDTSYVIRGWLSCFICIFGLIGNLLSVVVLTRPSLRILPINVILSFLTVCNSVYILLYLVSWSIPTIIARMEMGESENGNVKWNNYFMTQWRPQHYPYLYPLLWTGKIMSFVLLNHLNLMKKWLISILLSICLHSPEYINWIHNPSYSGAIHLWWILFLKKTRNDWHYRILSPILPIHIREKQ